MQTQLLSYDFGTFLIDKHLKKLGSKSAKRSKVDLLFGRFCSSIHDRSCCSRTWIELSQDTLRDSLEHLFGENTQ